jgi:hypothetical protein
MSKCLFVLINALFTLFVTAALLSTPCLAQSSAAGASIQGTVTGA